MDHYPGVKDRFSLPLQVVDYLGLWDVEDLHPHFLGTKAEINIFIEIEESLIKAPQSIENTAPDNETCSVHPIHVPRLGMAPFFHGVVFHKPAIGEKASQEGALDENVHE